MIQRIVALLYGFFDSRGLFLVKLSVAQCLGSKLAQFNAVSCLGNLASQLTVSLGVFCLRRNNSLTGRCSCLLWAVRWWWRVGYAVDHYRRPLFTRVGLTPIN